jgi:hypothetical protein
MQMKRAQIQAELEAGKKQMEDLLQEKTLLDLRIRHLSESLNALTFMLQEKPAELAEEDVDNVFGETGITAAIRVLLSRSKVPLAPVQIRTELMNRGFDLSNYENAMAVIHNTLKRLDRQGELTTVRNPSGQIVAYTMRWIGPGSAERSGMRGEIDPDKLPDEVRAALGHPKKTELTNGRVPTFMRPKKH